MGKILQIVLMKRIVAIGTIILLTACNGTEVTATNTTTIEFSGDGMNQDLKDAIEAGTLKDVTFSEENRGGVAYSVTTVRCGGTNWTVEVANATYTKSTFTANGNTKSYDQSNGGDKASLDCTKNGGQGHCDTSGNAVCTRT